MQKQAKHTLPLLTLFFLSPAVGELLSSSSPPAEFFNPFTLLLLGALYGSGAILVRELRVRWNKGWAAVFVLGAAYGIIEEGLMVKSFFDPNWVDIGILGSYGRSLGVNWIWTIELTIYHAVYSIAIPILLVELLFPEQRHEPWLDRRGMVFFSSLLVLDVIFGNLALTPFRPTLAAMLLSILAVTGLVQLARRLPGPAPAAPGGQVARPLVFGLIGLGASSAFFFTNWVLPGLGLSPLLPVTGNLLVAWLTYATVRRSSGGFAWQDEHSLALASGALAFFILLAPLIELDSSRPDNTTGMSLVGVGTLLFLLWLRRKVRQRASQPLQAQPLAAG
jgi:hypothetical protein